MNQAKWQRKAAGWRSPLKYQGREGLTSVQPIGMCCQQAPALEPPVTLAALDRVGNRKGNITSEQRRNQW